MKAGGGASQSIQFLFNQINETFDLMKEMNEIERSEPRGSREKANQSLLFFSISSIIEEMEEKRVDCRLAGCRPMRNEFCFSFFHFCGLMAAAAAMLRKREENERKTKEMELLGPEACCLFNNFFFSSQTILPSFSINQINCWN